MSYIPDKDQKILNLDAEIAAFEIEIDKLNKKHMKVQGDINETKLMQKKALLIINSNTSIFNGLREKMNDIHKTCVELYGFDEEYHSKETDEIKTLTKTRDELKNKLTEKMKTWIEDMAKLEEVKSQITIEKVPIL
ncbi:uncharacterized protein LOC105695565 [Orussus abietinus]|uniref:uncharacterized protein LOC105695565 n=1 Tax=Orussus abietinus TaxID=222816 RepID=UPI00062678C7|nr:uncharacterized protein LOC105695565 [Orussus abietinus]